MAAKCSRRAVDGSTIGPVAPDAWRRRVCGRVRALSAPASAACAANWGQPKPRPPPPINAPNFSLTCYRRKPLIGNAAPRRICTKIMRVSSGNSARKPSTSDARWCLKHAITTQAGRRDESKGDKLSCSLQEDTEPYRPPMSDVLRDLSRVQAARPTCHWWRWPRFLAWFRVLMVVSLVRRPASAGLLSRIGDDLLLQPEGLGSDDHRTDSAWHGRHQRRPSTVGTMTPSPPQLLFHRRSLTR